jgi:hypothetical protein
MGGNRNIEHLLARAIELGPEDNDVVVRAAGAYALIGNQERATGLVKMALSRGYSTKSLLEDRPLRGVVARLGIQNK